jgi:hypothetical protein
MAVPSLPSLLTAKPARVRSGAHRQFDKQTSVKMLRCFYRTTERAKFPIQDANHAVLGRMEDEVIELIVAMHYPHASLLLVRQVPLVPRDELAPSGDFAHGFAGINVLHGGLGKRDFGERLDLARKVRFVRAKVLEADILRVER